MILPDDSEFLTDLILQRTRPFISLGGKIALSEWTKTGRRDGLLPVICGRESEYVAAAVSEIRHDVGQYLESIGSRRVHRLVSIGCGNGIAEVMLCHLLACDHVLLVDTETGGSGHGFGKTAAGYGNLRRAADLMRANGLTATIKTWNPAQEPEPVFRFDALVSMYAMGFHFPADTYDGFIERNRARGAIVIHDSRQGRVVR